MPVSSDSLFHFTKSLDHLLGILEKTFEVSYSRENLPGSSQTVGGEAEVAVPMVSFSDLRLTQLQEYIATDRGYGSYGIGLSKRWGIENKLSPVQYVAEGSNYENSLSKTFEIMAAMWREAKSTGVDKYKLTEKPYFLDLIRFTKLYQAPDRGEIPQDLSLASTTKSKIPNAYRFADEREWRFVPDFIPGIQNSIKFSDYLKNKDCRDEEAKEVKLHFSPDDITHLIIKDDSEIASFVEKLNGIKDRFPSPVVQKLTSRIITHERLRGDF